MLPVEAGSDPSSIFLLLFDESILRRNTLAVLSQLKAQRRWCLLRILAVELHLAVQPTSLGAQSLKVQACGAHDRVDLRQRLVSLSFVQSGRRVSRHQGALSPAVFCLCRFDNAY